MNPRTTQTSKMECFAKIVNTFQLLNIIATFFDVGSSAKYIFVNKCFLILFCCWFSTSIFLLDNHKLTHFHPKKIDLTAMKKVELKILKTNFFGHTAVHVSISIDKPGKYSQLAFTYSKLTIETLEQGLKYVQS